VAETKTARERRRQSDGGRQRPNVGERIVRGLTDCRAKHGKTRLSPKVLARGESCACFLLYLFTLSAHHFSQPLHLRKAASSIYLTTHLSIYRSIHLPALITLHRLLFSFRTATPHHYLSSYLPLHLPPLYLFIFYSSNPFG